MRVLYVITSTIIGGAERKIHSMISGIDKSDFEVAGVISLKPSGPVAEAIKKSGVPVVSLDMGYLPSMRDLGRLVREIEKFKPDVVNAFLFRAIQFCRAARTYKRLDFKLVSSTEVNYRTRSLLIRWIDRFFKRNDELTVCESQTSADFLINNLGYSPSGIKVIKNGTDPCSWVFSMEERNQTRNWLKIPKDEILISSVGRLSKQKGHTYLIDAISRINPAVKVKCLIIGTGPEKTSLENKIRAKGLQDKIILTGEKNNIKPWLCASDIFVLPSLWEGIPIALLEAMAIGLPCLASSVDGIPEVIEDSKSGLLCPPKNPDALATALVRLCEDVPLRNNIALTGKKVIRDNFTVKMMLRSYEDAYRSVCLS